MEEATPKAAPSAAGESAGGTSEPGTPGRSMEVGAAEPLEEDSVDSVAGGRTHATAGLATKGTCTTVGEAGGFDDEGTAGADEAAKGNTCSWKMTWREVNTRRVTGSKHR